MFAPVSNARCCKSRELCGGNLPLYRAGGKRSVAADEFLSRAVLPAL
jgi:hypothetical protein